MSWINFFVRGACLCALVLSPGCRNASVTFNAMLDGLDVNFRSALPSVTEIETIGCSLDADCEPFFAVPASCVESTCNPDPLTLAQPITDVDFSVLSSSYLRVLDRLELRAASYDVSRNTLPVDVGGLEIFWGPAGASGVDSPGVYLLGTMPGLDASSTSRGEIELDPVGNTALSDYLQDMSTSVRFFARTTVDLEPGDMLPESVNVEASLLLTIRASGELL